MNIGRCYRLWVHATVFLGILAYSGADDDMTHALIALPVIVAAYMLTGGPSAIVLPRWAINGMLLAATVNMGFDWIDSASDTVSVLSRYVTWLQLIKLFEPRVPRDQMQVIALSVALALGACLTSVTAQVGAALLLYFPALLMTILYFQLWSGQYNTAMAQLAALRPPQRGLPREPGRASPRWRRSLRLLLGISDGPAPIPAEAASLPPIVRRQFRRIAATLMVAITALAITVYIVMPRGVGMQMFGEWSSAQAQPMTGFRDHVQLGAQGTISESRRPVMEMRIEAPYDPTIIGKRFRLRGAVLDEYDTRSGTWKRGSWASRGDVRRGSHQRGSGGVPYPHNEPGPFIRQHFTLIDRPVGYLFTTWRPVEVAFDMGSDRWQSYTLNPYDGVLSVPNRVGTMRYIITSSPWSEAPTELIEAGRRERIRTVIPYEPSPPEPRVLARPDPPVHFTEGPIRELSRRILEERRVRIDPSDPDSFAFTASAFQIYLQKNYAYTTEMIAPEPGQDPIHMFLFDEVKGKKGHCEYFASAMASLCLSVGIPARVVTGYIASEYDYGRGVYIIRENHAHAWAEVEVRPGRWMDFDPSPVEVVQMLHESESTVLGALRDAAAWFEQLWFLGVVSFDQDNQAGALRAATTSPALSLRNLNEWLTNKLSGVETEGDSAVSESRVVARFVIYVLTGGSALVVLLYFGIGRWVAWLRGRQAAGNRGDVRQELEPGAVRLGEIYQGMIELLGKAGYPKPGWQPGLSFVTELGSAQPSLHAPAREIARLFYEVRFGGRKATSEMVAEASARKRDLAQAARGFEKR